MNIKKLKEAFTYKDGQLYKKGKRVGAKRTDGYLKVWFEGKYVLAHRVVYALHNSGVPDKIDHINRNRSDNRIENLRACTDQQNQANSKAVANKKSKLPKGVMVNGNNYQAQIKINYKSTYLGTYKTISAAKSAYDLAAYLYFGEFANV